LSAPPENAKDAAPKDRAQRKTLAKAFDDAGIVKASGPRRIVMVNRFMRNPPQAKRVTRPSRWGNPHRCDPKDPAARDRATAMFEADLYAGRLAFSIDDVRRELRGWHLVCNCPDDGHGCHAKLLVRLANEEVRK
jgi:hypothetical protein